VVIFRAMKNKITYCTLACSALVLSSCLTSALLATGGAIAGTEALLETAGGGVKSMGKAVTGIIPFGEDSEEAAAVPAAGPLVMVLDGKREIDPSQFQYKQENADSGCLISNQGAVTEVYRIKFTSKESGTYTYESRMMENTVVGKSEGTFVLKER